MKTRLLIICLLALGLNQAFALDGGPSKSTKNSPFGLNGMRKTAATGKLSGGLSLYAGYSNLHFSYDNIDDEYNYCGYDFGLSGDLTYNLSDNWALRANVRLIDYSRNSNKEEDTSTLFGVTTTTKGKNQLETHTGGVDIMADWQFAENMHVFIGPGITYNYLINGRYFGTSTTTYMGNTTTTDFGSKDWSEVNSDDYKIGVGLNIGYRYDFGAIQPFIAARIPFTPILGNDNSKVTLLTINGGVRYEFGAGN